jgi:hypothetical protein
VTAGYESFDKITLGNGNGDSVSLGFSSSNTITVGNGNGDVVTDFDGSGNTITVGNGYDTVFGGANDAIIVGNGQDQLFAGPGDVWTVGRGLNVFTFNPGFGNNTIVDFNTSHDVLQFNDGLMLNYAAAMADTKQVGANTVIAYDANDTVTLTGVTASHLSASDFRF